MKLFNLSDRGTVVRKCDVACAALLMLVGFAVPSYAVTDSFNDGNGDHLVLQAEDFTTNVINSGTVNYPRDHPQVGTPVQEGWDVISAANAAGSKAIQANANLGGGGGNDNAQHAGTASYDVRFNATGVYTMYLRASMYDVIGPNQPGSPDGSGGFNDWAGPAGAPDGAYQREDSFYYPDQASSVNGSGNFTPASSSPTASNSLNWGELWASQSGVGANTGHPADGVFDWWINNGPGNGPTPKPLYTIAGAELGNALQWTLDTREAGMTIDAFILSTNANLSLAELNSLAGIPEPSTMAICALGVMGLFSMRRR